MKRHLLIRASSMLVLGLAILLWPLRGAAQVEVRVSVPLITFETAPVLVVVEPGIQVVHDAPYEVFYVDGYYWNYYSGYWFRSPDWHTHWIRFEQRDVPPGLLKIPPGRYKHFKGPKHKISGDKPGKQQPQMGRPGKGGKRGKGGGKGKH
jgi:hypothetical protein